MAGIRDLDRGERLRKLSTMLMKIARDREKAWITRQGSRVTRHPAGNPGCQSARSWKIAAAIALTLSSAAMATGRARAEGADLFVRSWQEGRVVDAERALPIIPFYQGSAADAPAEPGTLVRAEPATDFRLPPGVTATRILYHTRTANNVDALASGVVLIPYGKPPKGGWPLLAWSHGTSGVARACAPSLMISLFYNWEGLYEYVTLGYAVVATDYAGLGTTGRHAYLDMLSNATDVIHSVPAARAAVPGLSEKWIVIGHSQGGLSTLGVAQLENTLRDPHFLGTVTLAGASDLEEAIDAAARVNDPMLNGLLAFIVFGGKTIYPQLELSEILTDTALARYNTFVEDGCRAAYGAFGSLAPNEMFKPGWTENPLIKQLLARDRPGVQPVRGPLLLVTGGTDVMFVDLRSPRRACRRSLARSGISPSTEPPTGQRRTALRVRATPLVQRRRPMYASITDLIALEALPSSG
jgi:pimeloyl-ACP methyl ester carboxylesterase